MQENELYIEDQRVDLSENTTIALTFQINSIADLQNRNGNYSNIFKLPKTVINRGVFEDMDLINSDTNIPYQFLNARLIKNGFVVIPSGVATIQNVNDSYNVRVNSGNVDYFARIEGLTIGSLFSEFQQWNITNIFDSRNNTENWIYAFISFMDDDIFLFDTNKVDVDNLLPSLFVKTIFERSANSQGFYLSGSFYNSEILEKLILTCDSFFYPQSRIDYFYNTFFAEIPASGYDLYGTTAPVPVPALFIFDKITNDYDLTLDNGITTFNPAMNGSLDLIYDFEPFIVGAGVNVDNVEIFIYNVTTATFLQVTTVLGGTGPISAPLSGTYSYLGGLVAGHTYRAGIRYRIITDNVNIDFGVNYITKFELRFKSSAKINFKGAVYFEDLFQMKQKDLIKDVLNQFGVLVQTNNLTNAIEYNYFSDLEKNKPLAEDWSSFVDVNSFEMVFRFGNYGKQNNFKYKDESTVLKDFGNGFFELFDENLNPVYEAVQMVTSATESIIQEEKTIPYIHVFDTGLNFTNRNNRILILDKQDGVDYQWRAGADTENSDSNVPFCYFQQEGKDVNLTFDRTFENNLIDLNYTDLINVIDKVKVCNLFLNTNSIDIPNINFMIPIFLNVQAKSVYLQGYFYINKIENYVKNLTKFELVKL